MNFSEKETRILNILQRGLEPVEDPFIYLSEISGLPVSEILEIITDLKEKKVIRNISGIFDGETLGYSLSLVSFKVPQDKIERAGEVINSHPGVSHNYLRKHEYNIWFTLAEENEDFFHRTISAMKKKIGIDESLVLKNEKLLKIGVLFDMEDKKSNEEIASSSRTRPDSIQYLTEKEREAVVILQKDLPVVRDPYLKLLEEFGSDITVKELLAYFKNFLETGVMRRYAAVLMHRNAGFKANAMTAWKPGDNFSQEIFINCKSISHLYMRTIYPGKWEYPLFAMIHAKTEVELDNTIKNLSNKSGTDDYISLKSLREFKKKKVHYFSRDFEEWKRINYD